MSFLVLCLWSSGCQAVESRRVDKIVGQGRVGRPAAVARRPESYEFPCAPRHPPEATVLFLAGRESLPEGKGDAAQLDVISGPCCCGRLAGRRSRRVGDASMLVGPGLRRMRRLPQLLVCRSVVARRAMSTRHPQPSGLWITDYRPTPAVGDAHRYGAPVHTTTNRERPLTRSTRRRLGPTVAGRNGPAGIQRKAAVDRIRRT